MPEKDQQASTMIRVPAALYRKLEILRRRMLRLSAPELDAAERKSIAAVFRVALSLGVVALERRYPDPKVVRGRAQLAKLKRASED